MKTVFIIGAGANVEIGMPSGEELKKEIGEHLDFSQIAKGGVSGNPIIYRAMEKALGRKNEQIFKLASTIKEAMLHSISIDNFIDAHRHEAEIALCAKLAIVASILYAEKQSHIYNYVIYNKQEELSKTWYPLFFQKISEGCDINEFTKRLKDISFIIFNYDRCFEYYMLYAIQAYYKVSARATSIVEQMNIIHPYGRIGDFKKLPLGESLKPSELLGYCQNISTFTEHSEKTKEERTATNNFIEYANRIIFLGFAYHQINLDLLFTNTDYEGSLADPAPLIGHLDCYGTGYDIHKDERKYIQKLLKGMYPRIEHCYISNASCTQFFKDFWHRLSFRWE